MVETPCSKHSASKAEHEGSSPTCSFPFGGVILKSLEQSADKSMRRDSN